MQDFTSLSAISNPGAGAVVLSWNLRHLPFVNSTTIVSVKVQRSNYEDRQWTTLATSTGADFAGSTYTDVPAILGDFTYRLEVVLGIPPHTQTIHSNNVSASMVTAVVLTATVFGSDVALSWTAPAAGEYVRSTVKRSADGGATFFPIRVIDGHVATDVGETLAFPGTYQYQVCVSVEKPEPEPGTAFGTDRDICSNIVSVTVVSATPVVVTIPHLGPLAPHLLTAATYGALAGSTITNVGATVITCDLGLSPGALAAITGFPPGTINGTRRAADSAPPDNTLVAQAKLDLTAAYLDLAGRAGAVTIPTELGGTVVPPGLYTSAAGTWSISTNVTLDAQGDPTAVWIFQTASTLITTAGSIVLINGAQAANVFFQVGSSATLGNGPTFNGNILALTSISAGTSGVINGRLLARNGAVTFAGPNTVTCPPGGA